MAGTGIWLSDGDIQQTGGAIWAQQQMQQLRARVSAGQQWAQQQIDQLQQQAQAQLQAVAPPTPTVGAPSITPTPVPTPPTPTPTPAAMAAPQAQAAIPSPPLQTPPLPAPTPAPAPAPAPSTTPPAGPPAADTTPPSALSDLPQAGQDWAQQQLQNLFGSSTPSTTLMSSASGLTATPTQPLSASALGPQTAPTPATTPSPTPQATPATPQASTSTPGAPAGPQPKTPGDLIDQARQAAVSAGIDPDIFARQIQQESGFNPTAKSGAGALGIAQFMPATAQGLGIDPLNAAQALGAAAKMDAENLLKYGGSWAKTLAAYNAGPGNVDQYNGVPPFQETQNYVSSILGGAKDLVAQGVQAAQNAVGGAVQAGQQAVQNVVQTGQTAVNTVQQGAQAIVARTSQFAMGLSSGDAMAFCYDVWTRVLTRDGFKFFYDLTDEDELATRTADGVLEYHRPSARQHFRYRGPMYHFKSNSIDLLVTPDHQMLGLPHHSYWHRLPDRRTYERTDAAPELVAARDMQARAEYWHVPALVRWLGEGRAVPMPELTIERSSGSVPTLGQTLGWSDDRGGQTTPMTCDPERWAAFVGLWMADGGADDHSTSGSTRNRISVTQAGGPTAAVVERVTRSLGLDVRTTMWQSPHRTRAKYRYSITHPALREWLRPFGKQPNRYIPRDLMQADPPVLQALLTGLWLGDGGKDARHYPVYVTTSFRLADDVAELAIKLGFGATITNVTPTDQYLQKYAVCLKTRDHYDLRLSRHLTVIDDWEGDVYCATVPNHTLLVQRKGRITWSGNCGPAAAMAFAQTYGRNPTVDEAKQLAQQVGWNPSQGMAGVGSEVNLLNAMGVDAHATQGVDWNTVAQDASGGNPVIIDTPGHYFYVDGFNAQTGQFHLGTSASDLKAAKGQEWFTPSQIPSLGMGDPRAAIFADHPLAQQDSVAQSTSGPSSNQPMYMGTMQPASAGSPPAAGQSLIDQLLNQGSNAASSVGGAFSALGTTAQGALGGAQNLLGQAGGTVQDQAQNIQNAVQNVGGAGQGLLSTAATDVSQAPQTLNDLLTQNALMSAGVPTNVSDLSAQGSAGANVGSQLPTYLQSLLSPGQNLLGSTLNSLLYGPSGQPPTQAQMDQAFAQGGVSLPSNPLDMLGGMSPYGIGTAGQQLTDVRNQAIAQANPLRDVPGLGGLSTLAAQAALDPTNAFLLPGASTIGQAAVPALGELGGEALGRGLSLMDLLSSPEAAYATTRQAGESATDYAARLAGQAAEAGAPSGITPGQWLRGIYRGGIVSAPSTMLDVASSSGIMPIISHLTGTTGDLLGVIPDVLAGEGFGPTAGRLQGRAIGAAAGIPAAADQFLQQLTPTARLADNPQSLIGRAEPGLEQLAAYGAEGAGALHGSFSQAARTLVSSDELGAIGGEVGARQGLSGQDLKDFVLNFIQNPPADAKAAADAVGARVSSSQDLGWLAGGIGQGVAKIPDPIGSALFPVYRKGMQIASRAAEFYPGLGTFGTAVDVARGLLGSGPYAGIRDAGSLQAALDLQPEGNVVGPLAERLRNNAIGTALGMWLASKADIHQPGGASITGSWQGLTPEEQDVLRAQGQMPNGFQTPWDGTWHDWSKVNPAIRGPLMLAGAYGDSQHAYDKALVAQQSAGPLAYGVEDPHMAQAGALLNEIGTQFVNQTPLQNLSSAVDLLTGGGGRAGLQQLVDLPSSILGGLVPGSAVTRSIAQATDPLQRQTLRPQTYSQVLPAILQNLQQNIPGVRESGIPGVIPGLPARVDVLGRDIQNPQQGLGGFLPFHPAAGQPSPVLAAMANAGVTPRPVPTSIPMGPNLEIKLTPAQQQQYERYRGAIVEQAAANLPQNMNARAQSLALSSIDQAADQAARGMLLGNIASGGNPLAYANATGVLAPRVGYGPSADFAQQQQLMAQQRALMASLFGQAPAQSLATLNPP